jgi:hypothetical protein
MPMAEDFALKFPNALDNTLKYLPYGVTSIEFAAQGIFPKGHIRPENKAINDEEKRFIGFAKASQDFLVVWGGGHEEGQPVDPSTKGRMFMQLIHVGEEPKDGCIIFEHEKKALWRQQLNLTPATQKQGLVRMKIASQGLAQTMTFEGTKVPTYYCRWWPPKTDEEIQYIEIGYPRIIIEYSQGPSGITSDIKMSLQIEQEKKQIAKVSGDLRYGVPHAEIFTLLPEYKIFVLRLWLYWIHKRFEGNVFYAAGNTPGTGPDERRFVQNQTVEVPDIERFDFVIDTTKNAVTWYGTDFHYQEYWSLVRDTVADAKIAGNIDIIVKTIQNVGHRLPGLAPKGIYNPIEELKRRISEEYEPMTVDKEERKADTPEARALLNVRTHIPYVSNSQTAKGLISSIISE